ncbi:hypothetical protein JTB14_026378 [Gonioctena quinquepunctata]|nr:hypothetical protein JTB14_026378 [Gonioctena quinquepunctata]
MANAGLVYSSAHFKALAVGGGVSEAFALAGERACYNSLSSRGDQLLVLGTKAVHMIKLRTWPERLMYLSDQGRWAEALNLAAEEGLNKESFTLALLNKYLENLNQNTVDKDSLTAAINCCVKLGKIDILCNELLEAVSTDQNNQDWYYMLLTDHICTGTLKELSPSVAQIMVKYLEEKDLHLLENVLLSLDMACLDLHQVLKICKSSKLYNAWIHITTKTLRDYTSPLVEFLDELTPENHKLGNTMLVYVSSCLAGLGYPTGNIPEKEIPRVKHDILRCLETIHSIKSKPDEPTYPYLRALLKYNIRECLNVVELSFTEVEFAGEMGLLQRQRLVQILLQIVTPSEFSESQIINLACFVLRLVISNKLDIDQQMLNVIIKSLTQVGNSLSLRDHTEREQAWLDLLNANKLSHLKVSHLLDLALNSKCYKVAEHLYELQGDYSNILNCYLKDPERGPEIFNYILNYINVGERCIQQQFLVNFKELVTISSEKVGEVVTEYFPDLIEELCVMLEDSFDLQYEFLRQIIIHDIKLPSRIAEKHLEQLCIKNKNEVCAYLQLSSCRNEEALTITRKYEAHEATALLLERDGEWLEALDLLLQHSMVEQGVSLCVRGAEHLDPEGAQKLWLTLLQNERNTSGISLRQLLHAAAPHVPPTELIELVSNASFGDIKGLLEGILSDYTHDIQMLSTTFKLLGKDLHYGLVKCLSKNRRGTSVTDLTCSLCLKSLLFRKELDTNQSTSIWSCGHCYHSSCIKAAETNNTCPKCRLKAVFLPEVKNSLAGPQDPSSVSIKYRPDLEGHF